MKKVGKTGALALLYFEVVSTVSLLLGLLIVNIVQPGSGMHVNPSSLNAKSIETFAKPGQLGTTTDFLLNVIPNTVVDAFAKGEILQVLFFAVLFGFALHRFGGRGTLVFDMIEKVSHVFFGIVGIIMKVAPIGAFGAMAFTIGRYGISSLTSLAWLMATFYVTCLIFVFVVLGAIAAYHGFNIWKFIKYIKEELLIVLGTSSSEAALPRMIAKMENAGANKSVVGLVIPTGYSFNLDGTSIYLTMAAVFIAQATDTPLDIGHQITLLAGVAADVQGRGGRDGLGLHRAGRDALGGRQRAGRGAGPDPGHRPLHVRGARADQPRRQRRRDPGRGQVVRRTRQRPARPRAERRDGPGGRRARSRARQARSPHASRAIGGRRSTDAARAPERRGPFLLVQVWVGVGGIVAARWASPSLRSRCMV